MSGGSGSSAPVDPVARLSMSDNLRAMLESAQSSPVLQHLYADIRERLDHVSSSSRPLESLAASIQHLSLQSTTILVEIQAIRELTKNLTTENALLRGRIRDLKSTAQVPAISQAALQSVADQANTTPPRFTTQYPQLQEQGVKPPTSEEFMSGVRVPPTGTSTAPQVQDTPAATSNPLKIVTTLSLMTTCDVPTPAPQAFQDYPQDMGFTQGGPYCPGLVPHVPMLRPFKLVVSYRHYRLTYTRADLQELESTMLYKIKRRFDSLYPTFQVFDGTKPIKLLEFLATVRECFNGLRASEALAVLALAYYLDGQAKTHYTALTTPGVRTTTSILGGTWPAIVDSCIKRYLTDNILQAAYYKITDAKQKQDEDENTFADRLISAARESCIVFEDRELVNYFIRGLLPSTRDAVTERVRELPSQEHGDITAARRVAQAEGNTYRARLAASMPSTPRHKTKPSLLVADDLGADYLTESSSPCWSPSGRELDPSHAVGEKSHWAQLRHENPEQAARVAQNLEALLFMGENRDAKKPLMPTSPASSVSLEDLVHRTQVEAPKLTEEQYRDAITVITADYWSLNCWTCKTDGHTTFTCPSLTPAQRLYFAYCYFLYQCEGHPTMRAWLHQKYEKREARIQKKAGSSAQVQSSRDPRSPQRPRSPGTGPHAQPYQNRLKRETTKNVRFNKTGESGAGHELSPTCQLTSSLTSLDKQTKRRRGRSR